ncbi:Serine protease inhibitor 42Dd [Lucilia cuprina]|nr:Serine protease inhibitor 42Dd [Lucilia cuprina]
MDIILALWTQSLNAQYDVYMSNSRGGQNTVKSYDFYSEYDNSTQLGSAKNDKVSNSDQLSGQMYNTNSRNAYGNTNNLAANPTLSHSKETNLKNTEPNANTPIINNLSTNNFINIRIQQLHIVLQQGKFHAGEPFNAKLFEIMSLRAQSENLVYSPISLQTILAFIFTMSSGKLYDELAQLLAMPNNRTFVAKTFENIIQAASLNTPPTTLIMANKLYYDYRFGPIDQSVRNMAKNSFESEMEQIDFFASKNAANIINSWVSKKTRNLIRDIVSPSSISGDTSALLLNSIYFKSDWLTKFASYDTETQDFFVTKYKKVPVDMMYNEDVFRYADFPDDLQASVVELPYNSSDLSMLLILPKDIEGLSDLERKLRYYDFQAIAQKLKRETVTVKLPRFKIEYETDLIKPLQQLGLNALFNNAGSINLFKNQQKPLIVDQFKHKSYINVNEAGTEAAAATVLIVGIIALSQSTNGKLASNYAQTIERNLFASEFYNAVASEKLNDNVVVSPAAVQISMALAFYGAKGKTATEMQTGLRLGSSDAEDVVRRFGEFQLAFGRDNNMRLANNIYINENLEFKQKFKDVAQRNFESNIEKADFHPPYNKRTAERINKAMETKTNGKITDILAPQQLNDLTEGVIVNGITFSAPWQKAFRLDKTSKRSFSSGRQSFKVDTMWTLNNFQYGEVSNLDAKVVELPYQNSDFSMVVILPNRKDGLRDLLQNLKGKNLVAILDDSLSTQKVEIYLPKFSATFGVNLEEPFKKLGVTTMFTRQGDFGNMYRMFVSHYINSANHKAYVEVSEAGTEQPLESGGLKNIFSRTKKFEADHPFVFCIKHKDSVIFMGHIANYAYV